MLAVSFVYLMRIEKRSSVIYVDHIYAQMLAESGVENGIAKIRNFQGGVLRAEEASAIAHSAGKPSFARTVTIGTDALCPAKAAEGRSRLFLAGRRSPTNDVSAASMLPRSRRRWPPTSPVEATSVSRHQPAR